MIYELYCAIEEDENVMKYLISYFDCHNNGDLISESTSNSGEKSIDRYRAALLILSQSGLLCRKAMLDTYFIKNVVECRRILRDAEGTRNYFIDARKNGENPYRLVLNLPITDTYDESYGRIRNACPEIYGSIVDIIKNAKKEIIILNPFFDDQGVNMIGSILAEKASQGVRTIVITRYSGKINANNRRLIKKLTYIFNRHPGAEELLDIFDYKYTDSDENEFSFHAKIVMSDTGDKAYMGSANITGGGLERLFEAGVILSDSKSKLLYEVIMGYMKEGSFLLKVDI